MSFRGIKAKRLLVGVLFLTACLPFSLRAQNSVMLTFTCRTTAGEFVQPDSITVMNLDRGWTETLYYPDTVYQLLIGDDVPAHTNSVGLSAAPNPFDGTTTATLILAEPGDVVFEITDLSGRVVETLHKTSLQAGAHTLRVSLAAPGVYMFVARIDGKTLSYKVMNRQAGSGNAIEYAGSVLHAFQQGESVPKATSSHPFQLGDRMRYVAHASWRASKAVSQEQSESEDFTLVLPAFCASTTQHPAQVGSAFHGNGYEGADDGLETVVDGRIVSVTDYDGNEYPVVRIGSQCWLAKNLRCTHSPKGYLTNGGNYTGYSGAYYYNYSSPLIPLEERGLMYNWVAAVDTTTASVSAPLNNRRGICPAGWHVPSDAEWTTLTNCLGGETDYWCGDTNENVSKSLAVTKYWQNWTYGDDCAVGNALADNNATGFSAVPSGVAGGCDYDNVSFSQVQQCASFWSSTSHNGYYPSAYLRRMTNATPYVNRFDYCKRIGISVRCLRD